MANITVLGAGAWGTGFGRVLADAGNDVLMWAIEPEIVEDISTNHQNSYRLPAAGKLPSNMTATGDRQKAVKNAEIIVVAIAAQYARGALEQFREFVPKDAIVVSLMKGVEKKTGKRMDEVVREALELPADRFVAVSGPNLSKQVALRQPTGAVVASANPEAAKKVADACHTDYFKPYLSDDVIGTEMAGSLKNVTALAVGMSHGAGYGENTAGMIMTLGLRELTRLGVAAGAKAETFQGLAGFGDLVATCSSPLSRNYTFGFNLGKGLSVEEATKASDGVAEGVATTSAVLELAKRLNVRMPLAEAMRHVLDDGYSFKQMFSALVGDEITAE